MKEVWWVNDNALSSAFYRKKDRRLKDGKGKGFRVFLCKECNKVFGVDEFEEEIKEIIGVKNE